MYIVEKEHRGLIGKTEVCISPGHFIIAVKQFQEFEIWTSNNQITYRYTDIRFTYIIVEKRG